MQWRSWLRHCAISRKVAGSIPDRVNSASNRHDYQEYVVGLKAAGA
jgi:hypothetical protein